MRGGDVLALAADEVAQGLAPGFALRLALFGLGVGGDVGGRRRGPRRGRHGGFGRPERAALRHRLEQPDEDGPSQQPGFRDRGGAVRAAAAQRPARGVLRLDGRLEAPGGRRAVALGEEGLDLREALPREARAVPAPGAHHLPRVEQRLELFPGAKVEGLGHPQRAPAHAIGCARRALAQQFRRAAPAQHAPERGAAQHGQPARRGQRAHAEPHGGKGQRRERHHIEQQQQARAQPRPRPLRPAAAPAGQPGRACGLGREARGEQRARIGEQPRDILAPAGEAALLQPRHQRAQFIPAGRLGVHLHLRAPVWPGGIDGW